jgi:SAM-dependent methyltransferase
MSSHLDQNRRAWDALVREGQRHTLPARDEDFIDPLATINSDGWLGNSVAGQRVLLLAAGGGRHSALYAAAGAIVTVVDLSPAMLELDRQVAAERKLAVRIVETSQDDLRMFAASEFDIIVQPVSTCYVPDVSLVYQQAARILTIGGLYISQHKSPVSLQSSTLPNATGKYELQEPYYRSGPLPAVTNSPHREPGTLEYLHRYEELLGGLCRSGFVIEEFYEPLHAKPDAKEGTFGDRSQYVAPYLRIRARRVERKNSDPSIAEAKTLQGNAIWLPE